MSATAAPPLPSPASRPELERIFALGSAYELVPLLDNGAVTPLRMANGRETDGEIWWGAEFDAAGALHLLCTGPYGYELFEARDAQSLDRLCTRAGGEMFPFSVPATAPASHAAIALTAEHADWRSPPLAS
jgi:hypothetical protein